MFDVKTPVVIGWCKMPPQIDAFRFWTNTVKVLFLTMIKDYEAHACMKSHFVLIFADYGAFSD